jgi:hypothetical protein
MDEEACNYNADANINIGCWYNNIGCECPDGRNAEVDECGVCDLDPTNDGDTCMSIDIDLIPEEYEINNIYPNPFNPVTNIEFSLPENAFVQMQVYNINGNQIATLINSFQLAGYYSISWNASEYSSGIYLIVMMSDTFKETRRVILIK